MYNLYIYPSKRSYLFKLHKLENVYLTGGIDKWDFNLLIALPSIFIVQWIYKPKKRPWEKILINYHKNMPLYSNINAKHIVLCCDHDYKDSVTEKCMEYRKTKECCTIIHTNKLRPYFAKSSKRSIAISLL